MTDNPFEREPAATVVTAATLDEARWLHEERLRIIRVEQKRERDELMGAASRLLDATEPPPMTGRDALRVWTIYDHPRDFPDYFVAREWLINRGESFPSGNVAASNSLDALRAMMMKTGLVCLGREPGDDALIIETWV